MCPAVRNISLPTTVTSTEEQISWNLENETKTADVLRGLQKSLQKKKKVLKGKFALVQTAFEIHVQSFHSVHFP